MDDGGFQATCIPRISSCSCLWDPGSDSSSPPISGEKGYKFGIIIEEASAVTTLVFYPVH